ncbi:MAG: ECF transporter S component [Clostridiales bacterium]|nr:ECF transporter S component [Clostridiales bacterium]
MKKQTQKTKAIALMGILTALLVIMAFTPLGYLKVGAISISLLMIPVALGAIALGPVAGAILGTIFGITSFAQCFGADVFGTFIMELNPFFCFVMCIVARALAGFLAGLVFKLVTKAGPYTEKPVISYVGCAVTGLCAALFNTLLFMGSLILFFWNNTKFIETMESWGITTASLGKFLAAFVGVNAFVEALAGCLIVGAIGLALYKAKLLPFFGPVFRNAEKKSSAEAKAEEV